MKRPTFFKFFDGYIETFRACETHKDRSILLLAMFTYWETGEAPTDIPPRLQDKWRFLYYHLKVSRKNAYAKLGENLEENEQEILENPISFPSKNEKNSIDKQSVKPKTYAQSEHTVSTYRIEKKEIEKKEEDSDSSIHNIIEDHHYPHIVCCLSDEDWREAKRPDSTSTYEGPSPSFLSDDDTQIETKAEGLSTSNQQLPRVFNVVTREATGTSTISQPSAPVVRTVNATGASGSSGTESLSPSSSSAASGAYPEDVVNMGDAVLQRIMELYTNLGKPVPYTYVKAGNEFGLSKDTFYRIINYLMETGKVERRKVKLEDGTEINSFTPKVKSSVRRVTLPPHRWNFTTMSLSYLYDYFSNHEFNFDESWDQMEFIKYNQIPLEAAYANLTYITNDHKYIDNNLWQLVNTSKNKGVPLVDVNT